MTTQTFKKIVRLATDGSTSKDRQPGRTQISGAANHRATSNVGSRRRPNHFPSGQSACVTHRIPAWREAQTPRPIKLCPIPKAVASDGITTPGAAKDGSVLTERARRQAYLRPTINVATSRGLPSGDPLAGEPGRTLYPEGERSPALQLVRPVLVRHPRITRRTNTDQWQATRTPILKVEAPAAISTRPAIGRPAPNLVALGRKTCRQD